MEAGTAAGCILAVGSIAALSVLAGKRGKKDGQGLSAGVTAGLIMGTLVGGTSTVGTAQLAFRYGMSAWWFTLGAGIACLVLGLFYAKPLRASGNATLGGAVRAAYGETVGRAAALLNALGTFINILAQLIAAGAVLSVVFSDIGSAAAVFLSAGVMVLYVISGGTKGTGIVGILKMALMYFTMAVCGAAAFRLLGGTAGVKDAVTLFSAEEGRNFASLFCRGFGTDIGSLVSLILGVVCTETYAQAVLHAKSDGAAQKGALCCAVLIPLIGIFGIAVGLYMRSVAPAERIAAEGAVLAKNALTSFILYYAGIPGPVAGFMLGTLFIAGVGTGAGLALGIANVLEREILNGRERERDAGRHVSRTRLLIVMVLAAAALVTAVTPNGMIQDFSFLSMGLRGCTVFAPVFFLLFAGGKRAENGWVLASVVSGTLCCLLLGTLDLAGVIRLPVAAVIPGICVCMLVMAAGCSRAAAGSNRE